MTKCQNHSYFFYYFKCTFSFVFYLCSQLFPYIIIQHLMLGNTFFFVLNVIVLSRKLYLSRRQFIKNGRKPKYPRKSTTCSTTLAELAFLIYSLTELSKSQLSKPIDYGIPSESSFGKKKTFYTQIEALKFLRLVTQFLFGN